MFDPYDPLNNYDMPSYHGGDADPEENLKSCLITGLMCIGFCIILVIGYVISKLY